MSRTSWIRLVLMVAAVVAPAGLFASSLVVGNCRPTLPSFATISEAVAAANPGDTIMLCPGTYNGQITITTSLTLEGISSGDANQVILAPLSQGMSANATDSFGNSIAALLFVSSAGSVNLSNITFDATGHKITQNLPYVVGVFYQNTSGTINRIMTRNQTGTGDGRGIWIEGGASNPSVTVENSSIHDYDNVGLWATGDSQTHQLTAIIRSNIADGAGGNDSGVVIYGGAIGTVEGNTVSRSGEGIEAFQGATGVISNNVLTDEGVGIVIQSEGFSVTANKILNSSNTAVSLVTETSLVKNNTIVNTPLGINFLCVPNNNVSSNIIIDATNGITNVPSSVGSANSYFNVPTIRESGC